MTLIGPGAAADIGGEVNDMTITATPQRILVVEDDPTIRRVIEMCLNRAARVVDLRADGASGLEAAHELHPDLVILDIAMPGIDGWQVLRELRIARNSNVPVLVLTAFTEPDSRQRAQLEGADAYLSKPFRPAELRQAVDSLCR